jgi:hypothetical protein
MKRRPAAPLVMPRVRVEAMSSSFDAGGRACCAPAHLRRRFGYRRIHDLLRPSFPAVNHKRIYRLYTETKLTVRRRRKAKRPRRGNLLPG